MFILDSLLIGGLRFVLDKVARMVDTEMDDEARLQEILLDGQMELEAGQISEAEYAALERDLLQRLSAVRRQRAGDEADSALTCKVTGADVEVHFIDDEHPEPTAAKRRRSRR